MIDNGRQLPTGTVTFLFTDIEGSTRLLQSLGDEYKDCLEAHASLIREAVGSNGGVEVSTEGDAFFVVFSSAVDAIRAAVTAQRALFDHRWPQGYEVRVRMGLHTGNGILGGDNYLGLDVHKAARIAAAGHGGQTLLSAVTASLAAQPALTDVALRDLGEHRLKDLNEAEHLYQVIAAGLPSEFPPIRTLNVAPHNLPVQLTSFIGRERELSEAVRLLEHNRIVTLLGPGGTGKTRLSLQLAAETVDSFPDGVFFVPLSTITDPDLVPTAILEALSLRAPSALQPRDYLFTWLAGKRLLLVLDNLEQLLGSAPLISDLVRAAPETKVLTTSRAPLRISGEQEVPVPPLEVPDPMHLTTVDALSHFEGVELFTERAMAVRPDFKLTGDNAAVIAELTARLDGLPLAIELAASRVKLLPPASILERLDNRLLTSPSRDLPARQQTIVNAIGWSYDLLEEPVRRLFERMSIFVGGAMLEEIETVCGPPEEIGTDILDGVAVLVDHSLLRQAEVGGQPRFRMLTVIREFALGALVARDEDDELRRRHALTYLGLAERATPHLLTSKQKQWLDRLAVDHDNLRSAIEWALETRSADIAQRLVGALWRFWQIRGHLHEARERVEAALELGGEAPRSRAAALEALGGIVYWQGEQVVEPYSEALAILREHGDEAEIANALYNLSFGLGMQGKTEEAEACLDESLRIAEKLQDKLLIGRVYWGMGTLNQYDEQPDSQKIFEASKRAAAEFEQIDAPFDLGWSLFMMANSLTAMGRLDGARPLLERGLEIFAKAEDVSAMILFLHDFAIHALIKGDPERAVRIAGLVGGLEERSGMGMLSADYNMVPVYDEALSQLAEQLPDVLAEG
ncbi:MAG TPA: adenylate/guanylate cyclase domain-containing protein, partial [Acidimicrobiia bacterium]